MPQTNTFAVLGAVGVTVLTAVLTALLQFFQSGNPWPTYMEGWLMIIIPAVVAGLLASLTPHYSLQEQRMGNRFPQDK